MSLGKDYLELINLMWDIEEIDTWKPLTHLNLAYVIDKLVKTDDYISYVENWKKLAENKECNKLCWSITNKTYEFVFQDERFSEDEKNNWKKLYSLCETQYNESCCFSITVLGFGDEKYAPEWFMDLFNSYMPLKEFERDKAIKDYCKNECGLSDEETKEAFAKISRWYDIHNEFYFFVKNKRFKKWSPVTVEAIPAEEIYNSTNLNPLEAYLFLLHLRERQINRTEKIALEELSALQNKQII